MIVSHGFNRAVCVAQTERIRRLIAGLFAVLCGISFERRRQFFGDWIAWLEALRSGQGRRVSWLDERRRMGRRVDLLQGPERHLRINLRGLDVFVSEDLLDKTDVGSVLVHVRRHAVAQQVAGSALAGLRRADAFLDHVGQMVAAERLAVRREERREVVRLDGKLGPGLGDVLAQPRGGALADGHVSVPCPG